MGKTGGVSGVVDFTNKLNYITRAVARLMELCPSDDCYKLRKIGSRLHKDSFMVLDPNA
jgi:hypothetical protein